MSNIQVEFREKFKKGNALKDLQEVASTVSKEEFFKFSNVALKSAYDKNRVKAVEYMLSFYEKNTPRLLMIIHLQRMLAEDKMLESGEKMLVVLNKNFTLDFSCEIMDNFINARPGSYQQKYKDRKIKIFKMLLDGTLEKNELVIKKLKI